MAQGGSCGVRTHGKTRFRTRDAPTRGTVTCSRHGTLLLDTVSGHDKISRAGGADGAMAQGHGTSLPGTAWTWHCDTWGAHGDNYEVQ